MPKIDVFSFANLPIIDEEILFMYPVHVSPLLQNKIQNTKYKIIPLLQNNKKLGLILTSSDV